jgi:nucleoid-associated protein YgaU
MFFKGSRYANVATHEITDASGRVIPYKKVRFIAEAKAQMGHLVRQEERLDHIAHRYYRDPERFWRICDANRAMWPDDLTVRAGRTILIPASEE